METGVYEVEAALESHHWWFTVRRALFARELAAAGLAPELRILDIGTSTGTNLRMLRDLGCRDVTGLDASAEAIAYCAAKGLGNVRQGDVCALPFADASFDFVLATDILEHVDDDRRAMAEIARVLVPGGRALITVPAFQSLWGLQDEVSRHKRRYRLAGLLGPVEAAGLIVTKRYYFNYLLFAPIWLARQLIRLLGLKLKSENSVNTPLVNRILTAIFRLDVATAPRLRPPFGVSILALARKPAGSR